MSPSHGRTIIDHLGCSWHVTAIQLALPVHCLADYGAVSSELMSLLFTSGGETRWIPSAPVNWRELEADRLLELLEQARVLPARAGRQRRALR